MDSGRNREIVEELKRIASTRRESDAARYLSEKVMEILSKEQSFDRDDGVTPESRDEQVVIESIGLIASIAFSETKYDLKNGLDIISSCLDERVKSVIIDSVYGEGSIVLEEVLPELTQEEAELRRFVRQWLPDSQNEFDGDSPSSEPSPRKPQP